MKLDMIKTIEHNGRSIRVLNDTAITDFTGKFLTCNSNYSLSGNSPRILFRHSKADYLESRWRRITRTIPVQSPRFQLQETVAYYINH